MAEKSARGKWAARSQRSLIHEDRLREDLERCVGFIQHFGKLVEDFRSQVEYQTTMSIRGDGMADLHLSDRLAGLEDKERQLRAYESQKTAMEARLHRLSHPTPAEMAARGAHQETLATLAFERRNIDDSIGCAVAALDGLLEKRAGLTAKMIELANTLDLTMEDGLDQARFDELRRTLPSDVAAKSSKWFLSFVGKSKGKKPYIVRPKKLLLPETLASAGYFKSGDMVFLTKEEAATCGRAVAPAPVLPAAGELGMDEISSEEQVFISS
jgi:hypothetical protein